MKAPSQQALRRQVLCGLASSQRLVNN
jgi:hypothetical protein